MLIIERELNQSSWAKILSSFEVASPSSPSVGGGGKGRGEGRGEGEGEGGGGRGEGGWRLHSNMRFFK